MAGGLANFVSQAEERCSDSKSPFKAQATAINKIQDVVPYLKMLIDDPASGNTVPGDKLKTLAELKLIDVVVNEKGKRIFDTFREIEDLTKAAGGFGTRDDTGNVRHYMAANVSAGQGDVKSDAKDDNILVAKSAQRPQQKCSPKSLLM